MTDLEIKTTQRYLSKVIWFGTKTGGEFGFIDFNKNKNNGIFFHKNQILNISLSKINKFTEDTLVTFKIRKSKKESGKLEAYDIYLIEDEKDFYFLLDLFFKTTQLSPIQNKKLSSIYERTLELITQPDFIKENKYLSLIKANLDSLIMLDKSSLSLALILTAKIIDFEDLDIFKKTIDAYISLYIDNKKIISIKNLISEFSEYFDDESKAFNITIEYLKSKNNQNIIHYLLWIDNLKNEIPLTYITENIFLLNDKYEQGFLNNIKESYYTNILNDLIYDFKNKTLSFDSYKESKVFYQLLLQLNLHRYISTFLLFTPPLIKIDLVLDEVINYFELDDYTEYLTIIDSNKQQLFIKRIFNLIHTETISFNLDDISQIKINDYSSMVVIQLINKISATEKITKHSLKGDVLKLIANVVTASSDLLALDGYFDLCTGRTKEVSKDITIPGTEKKAIEYHYEKGDVQFISKEKKKAIICEGRLSQSKDGKVNLSKGGRKFWWCRNLPCFDACRVIKEATDWRDYSLIDFLNILKISYDTNDIELLYATINKVNRYLERLNCRNCKRVLKPVQESRYGYDRVNTFYCDNLECQNEDQIYLTHCSNGMCDDVIDSRDVAQCPNNWYICENCFSCCATRTMYDRNQNLKRNRQELNQIPDTHRGKSIFCPNCGGGLNYKDPIQQAQEYQNTLEDFERLAEIEVSSSEQKLVGRQGINKYGNKWFVIYKSYLTHKDFLNYLYYWQSLGFHIPDFPEHPNKAHYLVAEPIKKINAVTRFNCQNCQHTYDVNSEPGRLGAVTYWHFQKNEY